VTTFFFRAVAGRAAIDSVSSGAGENVVDVAEYSDHDDEHECGDEDDY